MIALFILIALAFYFTISFFIVRAVYKYFGTKKSKYIATAIMILIPTWDVILGYPIYKLLCYTSAGVHIYKTVDNVEGFYVGKKNKYGNSIMLLPHEGYMFVDYKDGKDGKYYRNKWIDTNTSEQCVSYKGAWNYDYTEAFKKGKCIVNKEITESEISELWLLKKEVSRYMLFYLNIYRVDFTIENRKNHEKYFTITDYFVDKSWMTAINFVSGNKHKQNCFEDIIVSTSSGFIIDKKFIVKTLQTKREK